MDLKTQNGGKQVENHDKWGGGEEEEGIGWYFS